MAMSMSMSMRTITIQFYSKTVVENDCKTKGRGLSAILSIFSQHFPTLGA